MSAIGALIRAGVDTLRDPRAAAQRLMALPLSRRQRWEALLLVAVISAALAWLAFALNAALGRFGPGPVPVMSPLMMLVVQVVVLWAMAVCIHGIGRAMRGTGSLDDAIVLVAWVQAMLAGVQILQIVAALLFPPLSALLGLAGFVILFWLLTVFVKEMHGFRSGGAVFLSIVLVMVVMATLLRLIFGIFGINMMGVI